nr:MAG TPA: homing endonuclease [Caudoviricetes sp.]
MFNRQSAAKTLHKPLNGFEYRYIIYINGIIYDRFTKNIVNSNNNTVTIFGSNNKPYKYNIGKLLDKTFTNTDFSDYVDLKNHKGYIINKNGSLYNTVSKRFVGTTIKCGYIRYNVDWRRRNMHEVLADQFIPNPNNFNSIDHVDCDKLNNSLSNLEWCDIEENKRRAYNNGLGAVIKTLVTFSNGEN